MSINRAIGETGQYTVESIVRAVNLDLFILCCDHDVGLREHPDASIPDMMNHWQTVKRYQWFARQSRSAHSGGDNNKLIFHNKKSER